MVGLVGVVVEVNGVDGIFIVAVVDGRGAGVEEIVGVIGTNGVAECPTTFKNTLFLLRTIDPPISEHPSHSYYPYSSEGVFSDLLFRSGLVCQMRPGTLLREYCRSDN